MSATGDMRLVWSPTALGADVAVELNDLASEDGLQTAVALSLFTDRRAEDGDVLPDDQVDRRGWWADELADVPGDRIGSRLWLLGRMKDQPDVLSRAEQYAGEALRWMVDDHVADRVEVVASVPAPGVLGLTVDIFKPAQKEPTRFRFAGAWRAEES